MGDIQNIENKYGYWPVRKEIPKKILYSILAGEDRNFFNHKGVDYNAVVRAVLHNIIKGKRVSGASTIAMQVVRMEYPVPRTYFNKLVEMYAAGEMIEKYGHEKVLRQYLKIAPFGNQYFGIVYASRKYFDKPIQDLNWGEASFLSAIPKAPGTMNVYDLERRWRVFKRAEIILLRLHENDILGVDEYLKAVEELCYIKICNKEARPGEAMHVILRIRDEIRKNKIKIPSSCLLRSSIDLDLQKNVNCLAGDYIKRFKHRGAGNVSVIIAEKKTGEILTYLGSYDYYNEEDSGSMDYTMTPRSPGSSLKPFLYALGMMEKNYTGATVLSDVGLVFPSDKFIYQPRNSDYKFEGPILYRNALANSRNVPAVQILNEIGVRRTYDFFKQLNLVHSDRTADYYGLGLAIGGLYVSLYDIVSAYGILANDGKDFELSLIHDPSKKHSGKRQIIPSDAARMITLFLSDPMARLPSFPRMCSLEYPFGVAVKTGTSQGYRDAWTFAYTDKYVIGIWTGRPDNQRMHKLSGSRSSALLMRNIIALLHPEEMKGMKNIQFSPPPGYISRQICRVSGKLATRWTPYITTEWFKPGTEPVEVSDVFQLIGIDRLTGLKVNKDTPREMIDYKVCAFLEPHFSEWAIKSGIELAPLQTSRIALRRPEKIGEYNVHIIEPIAESKIYISPALPIYFQTIALKVKVDPPVEQVVWYIDDQPYKVVDFPYTTRWQIRQGIHSFQIKFPFSQIKSEKIIVNVH